MEKGRGCVKRKKKGAMTKEKLKRRIRTVASENKSASEHRMALQPLAHQCGRVPGGPGRKGAPTEDELSCKARRPRLHGPWSSFGTSAMCMAPLLEAAVVVPPVQCSRTELVPAEACKTVAAGRYCCFLAAGTAHADSWPPPAADSTVIGQEARERTIVLAVAAVLAAGRACRPEDSPLKPLGRHREAS